MKSQSRRTVDTLAKSGGQLWNRLVATLQPDIVVVSIGKEWLGQINLRQEHGFDPMPKATGYWTRLPGATKNTLVVQRTHIPPSAFQTSQVEKAELGRRTLTAYKAGAGA